MGKIDSWITKLPRLKNSKVARFSYKAEAYANDDIEGVENYDYSRDMNIPLATHTDFDPDVLSIGARTQFSSVTKNGLNHFFGRVSYNLNKVIDFLDDFLTDFISLDDRFTSFTEIVTFSSSATLSNYANGTTKRLLNTSGSNITITLPAGETYLGSNKITLEPSIMLTLTKRGTVWVNSSGNAITADRWKTARNVTISDADGTNIGTAVSVDGSENETLKLPATIKATLSGNASTATAPLYQWAKFRPDLYRYAAGESPTMTFYWHKLCKITTAMTFDIEVVSDVNYAYKASYRLSVTYRATSSSYSVSLFNLGQAVKGEANLAVALDADGYVYIQTNVRWSGALFVTLLYSSSSNFSVTMDKLGYAPFGTASGFTPVNLITQTGAFRWDTSGITHTYTPMINTDIIGNLTGNADTADKWKTSRTITISDADGTNTGAAVSVDGSENETLKLPSTIKANLTGNADTATLASTATFATTANVRVSLRHGTTWFSKTWGGLTDFSGYYIWTDGDNIYYSSGTTHYVLNKATSTWSSKTWNGLTNFSGRYIWTDGENIYYSDKTTQYVLNKSTSTWSSKTWNGLTNFSGRYIWTDGENIYYSFEGANYVLNKATSTWASKTWNGLTSFEGNYIWTDGENIYYSNGTTQYVLNKSTSTWTAKTWTGLTDFRGHYIWTDGENIYHSLSTTHYVLNKATSTWTAKTWNGLTNFEGNYIWTDGENIYNCEGVYHYVLPATRHNYVDENKYQGLFKVSINCRLRTLSKEFVFSNE